MKDLSVEVVQQLGSVYDAYRELIPESLEAAVKEISDRSTAGKSLIISDETDEYCDRLGSEEDEIAAGCEKIRRLKQQAVDAYYRGIDREKALAIAGGAFALEDNLVSYTEVNPIHPFAGYATNWHSFLNGWNRAHKDEKSIHGYEPSQWN